MTAVEINLHHKKEIATRIMFGRQQISSYMDFLRFFTRYTQRIPSDIS